MRNPSGISPRECLVVAASVILATIHGVASASLDPEGPELHWIGTALAPSGSAASAPRDGSAAGTGTASGTATGSATGTASGAENATVGSIGIGAPSSKARRSAPPEAAALLLREAEEAYRARRWDIALEAFRRVVALDSEHAGAWLRIGNLHHRRSQWLSAASAYRKAADRAARDGAAPEPGSAVSGNPSSDVGLRDIQAKALLNLASVNLEMAEAALTQAAALSRTSTEQAPAGEVVAEQARRLAERLQGRFPIPTGATAASTAPKSTFTTVPTSAPTSGLRGTASSVQEIPPSGSLRSPGGTTPVIEYLRGAPAR